MENKEKVYNLIRTKWIENKNSSFNITITSIVKDLNLSDSEVKNILEKLQIENKIRITSNKVSKETYHTSDLPDNLTVLEVVD
jgi:hypothetical protein